MTSAEVRRFFDSEVTARLAGGSDPWTADVGTEPQRYLFVVPQQNPPRMACLSGLTAPGLRLRAPLLVVIEGDGPVVAKWEEALLEGAGETVFDALNDLKAEIVDAYGDLEDAQARGLTLDAYPARLWAVLRDACVAE